MCGNGTDFTEKMDQFIRKLIFLHDVRSAAVLMLGSTEVNHGVAGPIFADLVELRASRVGVVTRIYFPAWVIISNCRRSFPFATPGCTAGNRASAFAAAVLLFSVSPAAA